MPKVWVALNLNLIEDESIDLVATHPPYANTIPYSKRKKIERIFPKFTVLDEYLEGMRDIKKVLEFLNPEDFVPSSLVIQEGIGITFQ